MYPPQKPEDEGAAGKRHGTGEPASGPERSGSESLPKSVGPPPTGAVNSGRQKTQPRSSQPPQPARTPNRSARPLPLPNAAGEPEGSTDKSAKRSAAKSPRTQTPIPSKTPTAASGRGARPIPLDTKRHAAPQADEELGEDEEPILLDQLKRSAPSWLVSLIFHLVVIIVLALLYLPPLVQDTLDLKATYAESLGEQLEDETFDLESLVELDEVRTEFSESELLVEDPLSAPPELVRTFDGSYATSDAPTLVIGNALDGRQEGMKKVLLAEYGGTATTEEAVLRGLLWLKRNQQRDGLWSLKGPYQDGVFLENQSAATAMALLAFQGAGHTHESGEFRDVVKRGWEALRKRQGADGDFYQADGTQGIIPGHHLYTHAQATIAICELYAMTRDESLRESAERALRFAEEAQSSMGGWRYTPGSDADLSVTGWFVMAFQSALMAGLPVNPDVLEKTKEFLRTCDAEDGIRFRYRRGNEPNPEMTAEGMLCWEYLGWEKDNERLNLAAQYLLRNPVDWENKNFYYWYYGANSLHHLEGETWEQWNRVMRQVIPENQVAKGREEGSWDPDNDPEGTHGGRLYATCMSIYCLEIYYRHLPIYRFRLK